MTSASCYDKSDLGRLEEGEQIVLRFESNGSPRCGASELFHVDAPHAEWAARLFEVGLDREPSELGEGVGQHAVEEGPRVEVVTDLATVHARGAVLLDEGHGYSEG